MGYLLTMVVLVGLWSSEDDHDTLDFGVSVFVVIVDSAFALVRVATLRLVLASLVGDFMLVGLAVPGQVI